MESTLGKVIDPKKVSGRVQEKTRGSGVKLRKRKFIIHV